MFGTCGCAGESATGEKTALIIHANDHQARHNREFFLGSHILCLNLVGSPGSGKTKLLEKTMSLLHPDQPCHVIEGDQKRQQHAAASGVEPIQVNAGTGCYLDAAMVKQGTNHLNMKRGSFLFIESVGNLVCPALFDLGENAKVAFISVTEGDDKPLKYPCIFRIARLMIINKKDLLPHVAFDVDKCIAYARQVNPDIEVLQISTQTGEGIGAWLGWLQKQRKELFKLAFAS